MVDRTWSFEGTSRNDKPLEQDAFLELESLAKCHGDVGRSNAERHGYEGFFENVPDLEITDHTSFPGKNYKDYKNY